MTLTEMHVKWSVILAGRLGPEILTMLETKGQVLHRVRVHLKVPGWLVVKQRGQHQDILSRSKRFQH